MIGNMRSGEAFQHINSSNTQEGAFRGQTILSFPLRTVLPDYAHTHAHPVHQSGFTHHPSGMQYSSESQVMYENGLKGNGRTGSFYIKEKSIGTSDEEETTLVDDGEEHYDGNDKRGTPWQRIKWTDEMVKLLIDIVHFIGDDNAVDSSIGIKRKSCALQKKGKWRLVSNMMNEKNCYVSPQQCEDKFNDLNKRYKRLNDLLGKDTAFDVAGHPSLLDSMNTLSAKTKDDIKKILTSKHTFYKEMHSFYNGPKVPVHANAQVQQTCFQSSVLHVVGDPSSALAETNVEGGDDIENERQKVTTGNIEPSTLQDDEIKAKQWEALASRIMELEHQKIGLHVKALELEKQHFKWQKANSEKDIELEKLRAENKRMKTENDEIMHQLKQKEIEVGQKRRSRSSMAFL